MEAIDCYTKAINLDPADAILPANRAIALIKLSRFVLLIIKYNLISH